VTVPLSNAPLRGDLLGRRTLVSPAAPDRWVPHPVYPCIPCIPESQRRIHRPGLSAFRGHIPPAVPQSGGGGRFGPTRRGLARQPARLLDHQVERVGDALVPVPRRVLVEHRRPSVGWRSRAISSRNVVGPSRTPPPNQRGRGTGMEGEPPGLGRFRSGRVGDRVEQVCLPVEPRSPGHQWRVHARHRPEQVRDRGSRRHAASPRSGDARGGRRSPLAVRRIAGRRRAARRTRRGSRPDTCPPPVVRRS
jgi:hypothetical protein